MTQDNVANTYGNLSINKIILNDLEAEILVKTDSISELNNGVGTTITNSLNVSGDITCESVISNSDYRIKRNIKDVNKVKALQFIKKLKMKTYNFFNRKNVNIGLIAQEVEQQSPEFVETSCNKRYNIKDFKSVKYNDIHNLLIPTVQLLIQKVEEQGREINRLRERLNNQNFY